MIPGKLARFLDEQANVGMAGTRDRDRVPHLHRAVAWIRGADGETLTALVPELFGTDLQGSLEDNGRFSLTIEQFPSHETYQFKGHAAPPRPLRGDEAARVAAVRRRFARDVRTIYPEVPAANLEAGVLDPALAVDLRVEEIYLQTPGPGAGARLVPPAEPRAATSPDDEAALLARPGAASGLPLATLPAAIDAALDNGVPSIMVTCSAAGVPNTTVISQAYRVDASHVALSFQFFNKTIRNVRENPRTALCINDLLGFAYWLLDLEFDHSETDGPLFDRMEMQIEAIASASGMSGIFKLRGADVYRVLAVRRLPVPLRSGT